MPQGLQVFNADESVKLDTNTLLGRVVGSIDVGSGQSSGTITHEQFTGGEPFLVGMFSLGAFTGSVLTGPAFSQVTFSRLSNNSITWTRSTNQNDPSLPGGKLYFGVY